ncbi:universal stress protein [Neolewinella aurantiaca]|uniref:Universal stress protein n=1 Tax=Neolewinella aurantiaca TaxID=2602767 RepID=A0A5C7FJS6_9BACT|nr:universal stress protein [Neolewinella aurantiaca]TXF87597.1 universal stress protein [Neolewinella aurantiaca]
MYKIIVPIDFSVTSADALRFGCQIADSTGYDLEAVHIYDGYDGDQDFVVVKGSARVRARVKDMLEQFVLNHADPVTFTGTRDGNGNVPLIKTREIIGSAINELVKQSRREDVALIVMGGVGTGLSSRVSPVFGSVARAVAMRADCPVLLIPKIAGVPAIKSAAIAFDEPDALIQLSAKTGFLRKALSLEMSFAHVMYPESLVEETIENNLMQSILTKAFPDYDVDFKFLPQGDITNVLLDYTLEKEIDLLILGRHSRNFLMRLLLKSEISGLLDVSCAPVLVIPLDESSNQLRKETSPPL